MTIMLKLCSVLLFEFVIADLIMFPVVVWCMASCRLEHECHLSGGADHNNYITLVMEVATPYETLLA
jgi:hypothetical protein